MSQALSTMSLTHGFRFTGHMQTQMLVPSLDASPGLDLLKKGDSLCSLHATYMLSKNPLLICTKPLYAVDKQCSFLAFTLQSDKRQTENHRVWAKAQEDDDMEDDWVDFTLQSDKRQTENHRVWAKAQEDDDMEDDWEYLETEFLTSSLDVSNGRSNAQEKMNHKHIKADAVSLSEVVTSCLKSDSKPKEYNHDKGQTVQMSEVEAESTLGKILTILNQHKPKSSAAPSRDVVSRVQSSNGKPPYNTSYAQDSNGKPPYKTSYAQSVVRNRNSKFNDPNHTKDESSVDSILDVLQKSPPRKHIEKKTSPITTPVVRQMEQVASISFQPENSGFADDSLSVGHDNEKQLKSDSQHAASHVTDTSSITAVKVGENESLMNDDALQIDSSHIQRVDPRTLRLDELRVIARAHGLRGYYKLRKLELLALLKNLNVDYSMYK